MAGSTTAGIATRAGKVLTMALLAALAAIVAALLVTPRPAEAAFPSQNGKLVFWATRSIDGSDPSATDAEIFSMNPNGTGLAQLTVNAIQDFNPAWSPDGTKIAFHSDRDGNGEIYVMDPDGTDQSRIIVSAAPAHENNPDWQPGT
jgi:dipeptidyl aminopeptidase/acylaminoacyl peptidase